MNCNILKDDTVSEKNWRFDQQPKQSSFEISVPVDKSVKEKYNLKRTTKKCHTENWDSPAQSTNYSILEDDSTVSEKNWRIDQQPKQSSFEVSATVGKSVKEKYDLNDSLWCKHYFVHAV